VNNPGKSRIVIVSDWRYRLNAPVVCHQCTQPPCARPCPVAAISRDGGIVRIDYERCIGCGLCAAECPFGAIVQLESKVIKCELCGGEPRCIRFCETGALEYVNDIGETTRRLRGLETISRLKKKVGLT